MSHGHGGLVSLRNEPEWPALSQLLDLSLKELTESTFGRSYRRFRHERFWPSPAHHDSGRFLNVKESAPGGCVGHGRGRGRVRVRGRGRGRGRERERKREPGTHGGVRGRGRGRGRGRDRMIRRKDEECLYSPSQPHRGDQPGSAHTVKAPAFPILSAGIQGEDLVYSLRWFWDQCGLTSGGL